MAGYPLSVADIDSIIPEAQLFKHLSTAVSSRV